MESEKVQLDLIAYFKTALSQTESAFLKFGSEFDARSIELFVESQVKAIGALMLEKFWHARAQAQSAPSALPCECGRVKHYVSKRPRTLSTVLGKIDLSERHYYHCDQCGSVSYLGDELRGCSSFSQLAEERIALVGKEGAFEKSAVLLKGLGAAEISATTVRDVCVRLGQRARSQNDADAAAAHTPAAPRAEEYCRRLAIGVDGIMLGRVDMQHRRRKSAHGKVRGKTTLRHFFHEVKTLVVYDFDKNGAALRKTYHATQDRVEAFREKVASEALKRGAARAKDLVFLGDGAPWIWKTAEELFPHAVQVLDWYHATEHLWQSARAHFGSREKELHAWIGTQEAHLWHGRIDKVIEALEKTARDQGAPDSTLSEEARMRDAAWIAHRNTHYFKENSERMNYPEYRDRGLPIGSGVVEASCKHVVGDRLKRTGMRWDETGAESILALRCHHLNGRWDKLWAA